MSDDLLDWAKRPGEGVEEVGFYHYPWAGTSSWPGHGYYPGKKESHRRVRRERRENESLTKARDRSPNTAGEFLLL
jgi:hypothetical protein